MIDLNEKQKQYVLRLCTELSNYFAEHHVDGVMAKTAMIRQPQESDDINELIHISDERFRTIRFLQQQNDQLDKLINQLRLETEDAD